MQIIHISNLASSFSSTFTPVLLSTSNKCRLYFKLDTLLFGVNMYKSAKGEIRLCQVRFSAYKVSGEAPLIHKGFAEGARDAVCDHQKYFYTVSSVEASKALVFS